MIIKLKFPDRFIPEEIEFNMYCAIKLYKGNYIKKEEAMEMCGYNVINKETEEKFKNIYHLFEKRYVKICGDGYADEDFIND